VMRRIRWFVLSVVAVFVFAAFAAAGASAKQTLPQWGQCLPSEGGNTGRYATASCTVEVKKLHGVYEGPYEWHPAEAVFHGEPAELTGTFTFETAAEVKIQCTGLSSESFFKFAGQGGKTPLWELEGCSADGQECDQPSTGGNEEEISSWFEWIEKEGSSWNPQLGFIEGKKSTAPVVGISFKGNKRPPEDIQPGYELLFAPIVCHSEEVGTVWIGGDNEKGYKGQDGIVGVLGPVDQMSKQFTLTYGETKPGVPAVGGFEHKKPEYLEAFLGNHWEPVAYSGQIKFGVSDISGKIAELKAR